jgi:hypothetical protein
MWRAITCPSFPSCGRKLTGTTTYRFVPQPVVITNPCIAVANYRLNTELKRALDKKERGCKTAHASEKSEETMEIDRRHLALAAVAAGLLGAVPAFAASADEDAVAKNVEAFRAAQFAADAKAFDALCAAELSYSHSSGVVEEVASWRTRRPSSPTPRAENRRCCRWITGTA